MELHGVSSVGLAQVIHYAYTGVVEVTWATVGEVIATASLLQCLPVLDLCIDYLTARLDLNTYADIRGLADTYSLSKLHRFLQSFVLGNFREFAKTDCFLKLPAEEVSMYLAMDTLKCTSEFKLFKIAVDWVSHDRDKRENIAPVLFQHIRFPFMSKQELKKVYKHRLIIREPVSRKFVEEAKQYNSSRDHFKVLHTSLRTRVRSHDYLVTFGCSEQTLHSCILYKGVWFPLERALDQPLPFVNAACLVLNNHLFVCGGGLHEAECSNQCFCFDPVTSKWTQMASMVMARRNFGLGTYQGHLLVIGGLTENGATTSSVERYSIKQDHWEYACDMSQALSDIAVTSLNDLIYTAAGVDEHGDHSQDFKILNPANNHWENSTPVLAIKHRPRLFSTNGKLHLVDVHKSHGVPFTLDTFHLETKQWSSIKLPSVQVTRNFGAAQIGDWVYLLGRNPVDAGRSKRCHLLSGKVEEIPSYPWCIDAPLCCVLKFPMPVLHSKIIKEAEDVNAQ